MRTPAYMGSAVTICATIVACLSSQHAWAAETAWWSFQPVKEPAVPQVRDHAWPQTDLDHFLLAELESHGLRPSPPADKRTLLRRATFDLIGLPPTPEEIEAFEADHSPEAFGKVVERLLASPPYGERWGRHWLDVVRYADTAGDNGDFPIPDAYRFRNYVIDSFNRDKPFDQFIREQIAGDLLPHDTDQRKFEQIVATGYLAISRRFSSLGEEFHLTLDDTLDNFGKAFLGLSVSCARCHEHKFDPIPQEDYYALYGIFQSTRYAFPGTEIYRHRQDLTPLVSDPEMMRTLEPLLERIRELDKEIFRVYSDMAMRDTGKEKNTLRDEWKKLEKERDELTKKLPAFDRAYGVSEGEATDVRMHFKGNPEKLGAKVPRGFLQALGGQKVSPDARGSGRLPLADWLTDPQNPLTARVLVNRVWQHHFGHGLVRTPNDFGTRGEPPTHPALLDYLARRFVAGGWSVKSMHRLILLSAAYQMAATENPNHATDDPENKWLWKFNRRRLDAEEVRDALLAVSGALDRSVGGAHSFKPEVEWRYTQHNPFVEDFPTYRRAVYSMQPRIRQQPFLETFDGADTNASTDQRRPSTTPHQALFMMNNAFAHELAERFAGRILKEASAVESRLDRAFRLALGRPPTEAEREESRTYLAEIDSPLKSASVEDDQRAVKAWASFLRVLLSSNEFMFVE